MQQLLLKQKFKHQKLEQSKLESQFIDLKSNKIKKVVQKVFYFKFNILKLSQIQNHNIDLFLLINKKYKPQTTIFNLYYLQQSHM